jgi:hypothetical protein
LRADHGNVRQSLDPENAKEICRPSVLPAWRAVHPAGAPKGSLMMRCSAILAVLALTTPALAQEPAPRARLSPECRAEVVKLCPPAGGGRAAMRQCLMGKRDQLSDGCRAALQALRAARQANGDMAAPGAMSTEPPK